MLFVYNFDFVISRAKGFYVIWIGMNMPYYRKMSFRIISWISRSETWNRFIAQMYRLVRKQKTADTYHTVRKPFSVTFQYSNKILYCISTVKK